MALTVGEVNAILKCRDELSAVVEKAGDSVQAMGEKTEEAGTKVQSFGQQFEQVADRLIERLAIFESIKKGFDFISGSIKEAAALEDLSRATGISTDGLQRLTYAGAEFDVSAETITRAVEMLSARIANGDKNATLAVNMLGLSIDDLKSLGPEEAFRRVAEAAGRIEDPMTKAGIASDLFGQRVGRQLIPMFDELKTKMAGISDISLISPGAIKGMHDFEVSVEHLGMTSAAVFVNGMGFWQDQSAKFFSLFTGGSSTIGAVNTQIGIGNTVLSEHADKAKRAAAEEDGFQKVIREVLKANAELSDQQKTQIQTLHMLGESNAEITRITGVSENIVAQYVETIKKAQEAQKKWAEATKELLSVSGDYKKTLDEIDGATVDAIRYYLKAGVSQHALAEAYGLTAAQVKAVAESLKTETEAQKLAAKANEEVTKLKAEYYDLVAKNSGSSTDRQIADVKKWADDLIAKHQLAKTDTAEFYEWVARISKEKLDQVGVNHAELDKMSRQHWINMRDEAVATYEAAMAASGNYTHEALEELHQKMLQAIDDLDHWRDRANDDMKQVSKQAQQTAKDMSGLTPPNSRTYDLSTQQGIEEFKKLNPAAQVNVGPDYFKDHTLQDAIQAGLVNLYAGYGQGFNQTGSYFPNSPTSTPPASSSAVVGSARTGGSTSAPSGGLANAAPNVTNHFYVNGTAQDTAREISDIIMRQLKTVRQFGAA